MMMMCVRCCVITHLVLHFSTTLLNYVLLFLFAFFLIVVCLCRRVPVCVCVARSGVQKPPHVFNEFFFDQTQKIPALAFSFFFRSTNSPFLWLISKNTHKQPTMCCVQYYTTTNNNNNKTGKAKRRNLS